MLSSGSTAGRTIATPAMAQARLSTAGLTRMASVVAKYALAPAGDHASLVRTSRRASLLAPRGLSTMVTSVCTGSRLRVSAPSATQTVRTLAMTRRQTSNSRPVNRGGFTTARTNDDNKDDIGDTNEQLSQHAVGC